ncbi:MAG: hypothetical protein AAGK97_14025, partial [Bacteroidota bacterium]
VVDLINDSFDPSSLRFYNDRILDYYNTMQINEQSINYLIELVSETLPDKNYCPNCRTNKLQFQAVGIWD